MRCFVIDVLFVVAVMITGLHCFLPACRKHTATGEEQRKEEQKNAGDHRVKYRVNLGRAKHARGSTLAIRVIDPSQDVR